MIRTSKQLKDKVRNLFGSDIMEGNDYPRSSGNLTERWMLWKKVRQCRRIGRIIKGMHFLWENCLGAM